MLVIRVSSEALLESAASYLAKRGGLSIVIDRLGDQEIGRAKQLVMSQNGGKVVILELGTTRLGR